MGKQYNTELQAKVEAYMKETGISQAKLAPMMNLSGAVLSQYRRSVYDKGDVEDVERKIREFFQIKEEQAENAKKTESFNAVRGYVATSISESIYKMIRYCQLEKGIVVIDGDAGIGKTKAATKFLRDNPATAIYISTTPSTSSVRSLLRMIARALKISENQRTEDLSFFPFSHVWIILKQAIRRLMKIRTQNTVPIPTPVYTLAVFNRELMELSSSVPVDISVNWASSCPVAILRFITYFLVPCVNSTGRITV